MLPAIDLQVKKRPGVSTGKDNQYIPDDEKFLFWKDFYKQLQKYTIFDEPVSDIKHKINPYFGFWGVRFHPNTKKPGYFHSGISITENPRELVRPVCDGVLEYSGFDVVNGFYVFLSHPHIETEDGYVLHSLYMHLRKPLVKFSSYQKMLREISFNAYPKIPIERGTSIGEIGASGIVDGKHHHLHLQVEFRHPVHKKVIVIDPLRMYGGRSRINRTADFKSLDDFEDLYNFRKKEIHTMQIHRYFE